VKVLQQRVEVLAQENTYLRTQLESSEEIRKNQNELIKLLKDSSHNED
jgi:lipid II:glycine glycyltransferase (peptidoglycan interpeptide bridge formation enzyme)